MSDKIIENPGQDHKLQDMPEYDEYIKNPKYRRFFEELELKKSIKNRELELKKQGIDFSLKVTDEIWNDVQRQLSTFDESEREFYTDIVSGILTENINSHADQIIEDFVKNYTSSFNFKLLERLLDIPAKTLNAAVDECDRSFVDGPLFADENIEPYIRSSVGEYMNSFAENMIAKRFPNNQVQGNASEFYSKNLVVNQFMDQCDSEQRKIIDLVYNDPEKPDEIEKINKIYKDIQIKTAQVYFDVRTLGKRNAIFSNIRTEFESFDDDSRLTDVFCGGNLKEFNEILNEMDTDELAEHFDTALVEIVHSQGHSLNEFAEAYFSGKKTNDEFLNSVVTALREHPELSQLNVRSTLVAQDFDIIRNVMIGEPDKGITITKGSIIELTTRKDLSEQTDGKDLSIQIQTNKHLVIKPEMVDKVRFTDVDELNPLLRGAAKDKGKSSYLLNDIGFAKEVNNTVNYLDKLEKGQINQEASKPKKKLFNISR